MPIDTSMYATAPKPVNPMEMLGQVAQFGQAANQNKLFQQEFAARKAVGEAYQKAIGPDGKVDTNKLMAAVAANPASGYMAGDVAAQAQQRQQGQLSIDTAQLDLANKHLAGMNDTIGALLANPNVTPKDVIGKIGDMIAEGRMTKEIAMQELSSMPQDGPQLRMWLTQHLVQNLDSQAKVQALYGQVQQIDSGGNVLVGAASPVTGYHPLATVQKTMSPGEAASPVAAFDPVTGQPIAMTKQQFADQAGGVQRGGPLAPAAGAPGASAFDAVAAASGGRLAVPPGGMSIDPNTIPPPPTDGVPAPAGAASYMDGMPQPPPGPGIPGQIVNGQDGKPYKFVGGNQGWVRVDPLAGSQAGVAAPKGPIDPLAAAAGAALSKGVPTGPALGVEAAANVTGTQSAQQGVDLQKLADAVPTRKGILGNLETALGNFEPGATADWKLAAKKFANANSPFGNVFDPKSIASQEEFNKQATQLAQAQFQALGGTGTDAKLDSTMHTSPNEMLSKMGNKGIIAMLKGNEDAISAKNEAWQTFAAENGPQSYGKFSAAFNKSYDPRVFQWTYLDDGGKSDMLNSMTKAEKESYKNAFNLAVEKGWVADPRPPEMRTPPSGG